jgi:predicted peptidase
MQRETTLPSAMNRLFYFLGLVLIPCLLRADAFPSPDLQPEDVIAATPGTVIYKTKAKGWYDGKFAVVIPHSYSADQPMPLVVSAHGHGGNGEGEAQSWNGLPDKYNFILVCPSYFTSAQADQTSIESDGIMLKEVMTRVLGSLNIDRKKVLHTGFSGGGLTTWYVAAEHDEWFTALCFRSGNFYAHPEIHVSRWRDRPIYIMWGDRDLADIPIQGQQMLDYVQKDIHNTKVKHEIIPNAGHEGHPDLVAKWFAGLTDADFEAPDPNAVPQL